MSSIGSVQFYVESFKTALQTEGQEAIFSNDQICALRTAQISIKSQTTKPADKLQFSNVQQKPYKHEYDHLCIQMCKFLWFRITEGKLLNTKQPNDKKWKHFASIKCS